MSKRQIILDTETTGLEPQQGHRIIEIGCVEMVDRKLTGNNYHCFLNPEREIDAGAVQVHGITLDDLREKPRFGDVVDEFLDYIRGAELVIHNAPFDRGFLDHELTLLGRDLGCVEDYCSVTCTYQMARHKHPGQKNSLDALCKRYMVDNAHRTLHGALLDAEILADVYLRMTGGQATLSLPGERGAGFSEAAAAGARLPEAFPRPPVRRATATELAAHERTLERIRKRAGECAWDRLDAIEPG